MNNIEKITVLVDGKEENLYVLLEYYYKDKTYILYTKSVSNKLTKDDIYVGEVISNNQLVPVDDKLIGFFDKMIIDIINKKII